MAIELTCDELGVKGCDLTAIGDTPGEIVRQVVEHLESEHGIDLPDVDAILKETTIVEDFVDEGYDRDAIIVVRRLRERLGIEPKLSPSF